MYNFTEDEKKVFVTLMRLLKMYKAYDKWVINANRPNSYFQQLMADDDPMRWKASAFRNPSQLLLYSFDWEHSIGGWHYWVTLKNSFRNEAQKTFMRKYRTYHHAKK